MNDKLEKIKKLLTNKDARTIFLANRGFYHRMDDETYLRMLFKAYVGYELDLNEPRSFNEKMQWLKLYDHRPEYTDYVDKYKVRAYIEKTIGKEYLVPLIDAWDRADQIDFSKLPEKFVLKCNHDSGRGVYLCSDRSKLDEKAVRDLLGKSLKQNYYLRGREWPYKNVVPKIICEAFLEDEASRPGEKFDLVDYKIMCFGGQVKCSFVCSERYSPEGLRVTFFDRDWKVLPFIRHYPKSSKQIPRPKLYEKMIELSETLSKDLPFARIDWYEVGGKLYFGEITLYPGSGFEEFTPVSADYELGSWIPLPPKRI